MQHPYLYESGRNNMRIFGMKQISKEKIRFYQLHELMAVDFFFVGLPWGVAVREGGAVRIFSPLPC